MFVEEVHYSLFCIVSFLMHHLVWQDSLTTIALKRSNRNVQQLRQVLIVEPLVLMKRRILYGLWHSLPLLRDEQLGNLLQLFLQALVLLDEKLYQKAVLLIVLIYDNPGFRVVERSTNYDEVKRIVDECVSKGVEIWQANFSIDREKVRMERHFRLEL